MLFIEGANLSGLRSHDLCHFEVDALRCSRTIPFESARSLRLRSTFRPFEFSSPRRRRRPLEVVRTHPAACTFWRTRHIYALTFIVMAYIAREHAIEAQRFGGSSRLLVAESFPMR